MRHSHLCRSRSGWGLGLALLVAGCIGPAAPAAAWVPPWLAVVTPAGDPGELQEILGGLADDPGLRVAAERARDAGSSPASLSEFLRQGRALELPARELVSALDRFRVAGSRGLPTDPLIGRYLQGFAKGIPVARIHAVADDLVRRLESAASQVDARCPSLREAGRGEERRQAIDHAAYALGVGVKPEFLDRSLALVSDEAAYEDVRAPILAMSLLVSIGLEGDRSFQVVQTAWSHGVRGVDLERLGQSVARLGQSGQEPHEVASHVMGLLEQETPVETIILDLDALGSEPGEGLLPQTPGADHPTRRRVPGDRPDSQSRDNFGGDRGRMAEGPSGSGR